MTAGFFHRLLGSVKVSGEATADNPRPCSDLNITIDLSDAEQRQTLLMELDRLRADIVREVKQGTRFYRIMFAPYPLEHFNGAKLDVRLPAGPSEVLVTVDATGVEDQTAGAKCAQHIEQQVRGARLPLNSIAVGTTKQP